MASHALTVAQSPQTHSAVITIQLNVLYAMSTQRGRYITDRQYSNIRYNDFLYKIWKISS